jgi:VWFA-related protein
MRSVLMNLAVVASTIVLLGAGTPGQMREEPQVALASDLVEVHVTVVDAKGRPVAGLARSNFEVRDNGALQETSHFSGEAGPLSLAVVLDATGMASETVEGLLDALRLSRLVTEQASEISFLAFNEKASVRLGFVGTGDHVLPELAFADPRARLTLRDALSRVEDGLRSPPGARTLALVITDGGSAVGASKAVNAAEAGRAGLYAVFPTVPDPYRVRASAGRRSGDAGSPWWSAYSFEAADRNLNRRAVASLARRSGGRSLYAFSESEAARVQLFDQIGDEVASQYAIGFYPTSNEPGWHRVTVRVTPQALAKGLSVSHRLGYRAAR